MRGLHPSHEVGRVGRRAVLGSGYHIFALVSKDLERFVEDRSQLGKDRTATNATAFVMLDLWHRDARPVQFPVDDRPSARNRRSKYLLSNIWPRQLLLQSLPKMR
jgi:hypothetical protein